MSLRKVPILPLLILPLSILLLQSHGIPFWQHQVGFWPGIGWSVLLELISLWLWFQPATRPRLLALATTMLLLAGPLYEISFPAIKEFVMNQGAPTLAQGRIASLEGEITEAERSLDRYQRLALAGRYGWLGAMEQAEAVLAAKRGQLATLTRVAAESGARSRLNGQHMALVAAQALSLVIFQIAAVLAIRALGRKREEAQSPQQDRPNLSTGHDELVLRLQGRVKELVRYGKSYAQVAEETGIGRAHLSFLMNHFDRARRGERVLGEVALRGIRGKLVS